MTAFIVGLIIGLVVGIVSVCVCALTVRDRKVGL